MKRKVLFTILKEDAGYSAAVVEGENFIATEGETLEELKGNIVEAAKLALEDDSLEITDMRLQYDLPSFFHFYRVINKKALSERIGMNQSQLAQYISGHKKPSSKQTRRILDGVQQIGRELSEINIL